MDKNKLQTLKDIGYQIKETCETCTHSSFSVGIKSRFGVCARYTYKHLKHDGDFFLSIINNGWCDKYEPSSLISVVLESYTEFYKRSS
jgi:hypothetical protein